MAYVERDSFLKTPAKLADIACTNKSKAEIVVEELRIGVTAVETLDKITGVRAPR